MPESTEQLELFPDPDKLPPYTYAIPPGAKTGHCDGCGAELVFVATPSGSQMPLALSTRYQLGSRWVAVSHFRDCPFASAFGKRVHRRH